MPNLKFATIAVEDIEMDPVTQPRASMDVNIIHEYSMLMKQGTNFPPVVVFDDEKTNRFILADGWYRMMAKKQAAITNVLCEVHQGDIHDAVKYAAGANALHGVRRTNEDKHRSVIMLLEDEKWKDMSDRAIGEAARVDHKTVAKIREEHVGNSPLEGDEPEKRLARDGKMRPTKQPEGKAQKAKSSDGEDPRDPNVNAEPSSEDMVQADMEEERPNPTLDQLRIIASAYVLLPRSPEEAVDELLRLGDGELGFERAKHMAWWFQTYAEHLEAKQSGEVIPEDSPEYGEGANNPAASEEASEIVGNTTNVVIVDEAEVEMDELDVPAFLRPKD